MRGVTIFEFDAVAPLGAGAGVTEVPPEVFAWLELLNEKIIHNQQNVKSNITEK